MPEIEYERESLDGLDDAMKALYAEKDGKHVLNVKGLPGGGDKDRDDGLRSALGKERDERKRLEREQAAWRKLGKDPDEVAARLGKESKEGKESKGIDKDALAPYVSRIEALEKERDEARDDSYREKAGRAFEAALKEAGLTDEGVKLISRSHAGRIKMVKGEGGTRSHEITAPDGSAMIGTGPDRAATFADLAKEAAAEFPSLVKSERKGGAGTAPGAAGGSGAKNTMPRAEFDKLSPMEKAASIKAGTHPVDP